MSIPVLLAVAMCWFALGILRAVRDRAGERIARWLFPDGHPWTYRIAVGIAQLTARLVPKRRLRWVFGSNQLYPFETRELAWAGADAALAELETDLNGGCAISDPISLVLPLLRETLLMRLQVTLVHFVLVAAFLVRLAAIAVLAVTGLAAVSMLSAGGVSAILVFAGIEGLMRALVARALDQRANTLEPLPPRRSSAT